ncbi:Secreted chitinase LysM12-like protein [Pleurotus pulmonarius]
MCSDWKYCQPGDRIKGEFASNSFARGPGSIVADHIATSTSEQARMLALLALTVSILPVGVFGATCSTATVGQPFSTCFDIYTNAGLTAAQFAADNPGLDCSRLQLGQKVCVSSGTLPSNAPSPSPNGTCAEYTVVSGEFCAAIATKFGITGSKLLTLVIGHELRIAAPSVGCGSLQVGFTMCVSPGNPPPISIIPGLQCGPQSEKNATCPLNACCSAFGFCGITSDFCTTQQPNPCISNCFTPTLPSCSSSRPMRKVAYYAGFGDRRPCGINIAPDDIDWSPYTHVHFAFATITQGLQIQLDDADAPLLRRLVAQKVNHPQLKVVIAVGGWDFSESQPTRDLFSLMISSASNRNTFIASVTSFLSQFGVDGIDIDFEYPGAMERNAPATDTPNLTAFFKDLRTALPTQVISCAAPAGYWFLQGFEINKITSSVSYINMMSYDYHGQWDTNVADQDPVTNPHTSILDMRDSALLYVRAGIDLSMVNLGLAFYARTYQLANSGCKGYGCTMVGGGAPGPCSASAGILTQFEVDALLQSGITPTLDASSKTYWLDNQGSLVTFDQSDTWAAKAQFAGSTCFGGTFIWSLDQTTSGLTTGGGVSSNVAGQSTVASSNSNTPGTFLSSGTSAVSSTPAISSSVLASTSSKISISSTAKTPSATVSSSIVVSSTSFPAISGSSTAIPSASGTAGPSSQMARPSSSAIGSVSSVGATRVSSSAVASATSLSKRSALSSTLGGLSPSSSSKS